jgi:hypothetical protein
MVRLSRKKESLAFYALGVGRRDALCVGIKEVKRIFRIQIPFYQVGA